MVGKERKMITLDEIKKNEELRALINNSCAVLNSMNYTEHGIRHAKYVSKVASMILTKLGFDEKTIELGKIAGYLHDVGNVINRKNHGKTSGILLYPILKELGMEINDVCTICAAVGNHEESIGYVVNTVCAALIIADKSDAHRTRVRKYNYNLNDIHDRVNYAILKNIVEVDEVNKIIKSKFYMNDSSSVMEYFEIYINRIMFSEKAASYLGCDFHIYINDVLINSPKRISKKALSSIREIDN